MTDMITKFFCMDHAVVYDEDDMMCHKCETEICEAHDQDYKEKHMTEQFVPQSTKAIQEESLTNFMAAIGYEPVYCKSKGLVRFSQPRFYKTGKVNIGINTAIRMHNEAGEEAFAELIAFTAPQELRDYLRKYKNYETIMLASAGATKIIEQVKGSGSKRKGFLVHDDNIKFMTKRDERFFSRYIGQ